MSEVEDFMREFRRNSVSRSRLFRFASMCSMCEASKAEMLDLFKSHGLSDQEAETEYDKIVEIASKVSVRPGPWRLE